MPQTNTYDPENWLLSTMRALKEYIEEGFNNSVLNNLGNPVGLYTQANPDGIYEVIPEFPSAIALRDKVPLVRTVIHFEVDEIDDRPVGIGKNFFRDNYDAVNATVEPQEAKQHRINLDVGIWTSDRAGGTTSRMRAYQVLTDLFHGSKAHAALDEATDNGDGKVEILSFTGGRFITETINDIPTFRTVDGVLEVRVFSRTPLDAVLIPSIEDIVQEPDLTIAE